MGESKKRVIWTAKAIKRLRRRIGGSQTQFCLRLGVSIMTVSRWERGISKPAAKSLGRLDNLARE